MFSLLCSNPFAMATNFKHILSMSDALVRPVTFLVVHARLAGGGEQAVLCGASARRCKPFWISCVP